MFNLYTHAGQREADELAKDETGKVTGDWWNG